LNAKFAFFWHEPDLLNEFTDAFRSLYAHQHADAPHALGLLRSPKMILIGR
jgi:hypothetical protein